MPRNRAVSDRLVLASASERRVELLAQIGVFPRVVPANIDESSIRHDDPVRLAVDLAQAKVLVVAATESPPVLAADTVVVVGAALLEKPGDRQDAERMLRLLAGRTHRVITGIAYVPDAGALRTAYAESEVTFTSLADAEIEALLDSDEWVGVAGAYRVQGLAARHVTRICGSYSNVVGLPLHLVYSILTQ